MTHAHPDINDVSGDIIQSYNALDTQRKLILCDQVAFADYHMFQRTARLLWPNIDNLNIDRLHSHLQKQSRAA